MSDLITPGERAPEFALTDVHGKIIRLAEYQGRLVVLAFLRGFM